MNGTESGKKRRWWQRKEVEVTALPEVEVTLEALREAIHEYEETLPKGTNRTILLGPDQEIDTSRLSKWFGGKSKDKYYMSRETFHIVPEENKEIVYEMDRVQRALDLYFEREGRLPLRPFPNTLQIDLTRLQQGGYLEHLPKRPYYIVDETLIVSVDPKPSDS